MKAHIDGMDVETSDFIRANVSDYTVYEGKVWKIISRYGPAIGDCKGLERENAKEHTSVPNSVKLFKVVYPTGYIRI